VDKDGEIVNKYYFSIPRKGVSTGVQKSGKQRKERMTERDRDREKWRESAYQDPHCLVNK